MPPAVIPVAIGAAGAIGGAIIGSNAQKKAADKAADVQQDATAQQLQLGRESLALQEKMFNQGMGYNQDIYKANWGVLAPFASNGMVASNAMNALLGLPQGPTLTPPSFSFNTPPASAPSTGGSQQPGVGNGNGTAGGGFTQVAPPPSGLGGMVNNALSGQPMFGLVPNQGQGA